jgi:adhesin transport system outer membrane protein
MKVLHEAKALMLICFRKKMRVKSLKKTAPLLVSIIALGSGLGALSVGEAAAQPIEHELKYLIDSHPKVRASEKTLESRRASISESEALYYPTVRVTAEIGPEHIDTPTTRGSTDGKPSSMVRNTVGLTVTQNLFDGFSTSSQVRSAQINREVAELSLEGTRQNTLFEGIRAYVEVLRQRRLVEIARESERTILRQLNLEDERVRRGSGVTSDVLQAKSRLQIAIERRVGYEGTFDNAISTYEQVFGHSPDLTTMIDPAPPAEVIPSTMDRAMEIALMENPALVGSAASVELAREGRRSSDSEFFPVVDLVGAANYEKNNGAVTGTRRDYSMSLSASWDLFSGGESLARRKISNFDYQSSMDNLDFSKSKVIEQVKLSWQSLVTSRKRRVLLGNAVNIAAEVFEGRKKLRDAGKETVINVLDQENELNNTQINYATSSYDERITIYQLLLAMGRLSPQYIVATR